MAQIKYTEANKQVKESIRADKQKFAGDLAATQKKGVREKYVTTI